MAGETLPESWKWTTFGTVADFVNGDRGENYPTQSDRVGAGVPFINTGHIDPNGRLTSAGMDYITRESFERLRSGKVNLGDIVYCLRGSTIGKTARNHFAEGAIASSLVIVRAKAHVCQEYLYFYLTSPLGKQLVAQHDNGSAQPNLSVQSLCNYPLPLPPVDEQRAIAHILGTLDDKIELNRRTNETLESMARALFKSWFVDFDPVRAKAEGRDPGLPQPLADLFPDSFEDSELGEIPKGWGVQQFADTVDIIGGGTPKTSVAEYWDGDIPWFSVVDAPSNSEVWVVDTAKKITRKGVENSSTRILPVGTTIISARGTVGRIALVAVPMAMNQSCYGLRGKVGASGFYTYYATRELVTRLQQHAHGSVFDTITQDTLAGVSLASPPARLIEAFETRIGSTLERIRVSLFSSRTLATLRDTLLPKLISGELRVQDASSFSEQLS